MKLAIRDIGPIISLDLDLSQKVTLVTGINGAGKSTTASCAQIGATGEAVPPTWKKAEIKEFIRDGATAGSVRLVGDSGSRFVSYPDCKPSTPEGGKAPWASDFACGRRQLLSLDLKERTQELVKLLNANPTLDDFNKAIEAKGLGGQVAKDTWEKIETKGWNDAHEEIKKTGASLKGQWQGVSKVEWGNQKGPGGKNEWKPENWVDDLKAFDEARLVKGVEKAKKELESAVATNAVTDAERTKLQELAAQKDVFLIEHKKFSDAEKEAQAGWKAAREKLEAYKVPSEIELTEPCAHCGQPNVIRNGKLVKPDGKKPSKDELQESLGIKKELQQAVDVKMAEWDALKNDTAKANHKANEAARAETRLKELSDQTRDDAAVQKYRDNVAQAEKYLAAFKVKTEADKIDRAIHQNLELQALLAPDGLRLQKLSHALDEFNKLLATFSQTAAWKQVQLGVHGATYGGEAYRKLSGGFRFRVDTLIQMAIATVDNSDLVVIDIDTLIDVGARVGFFKLASSLGIPVLACMMFDADKVPDLAAAGFGTTYVLEAGRLKEPVRA